MKSSAVLLLLATTLVHAATLPGFGVRQVAAVPSGFLSSIVTDSHGIIYYTTTAGDIVRLVGAQSVVVAHVNTIAISNSGLLGMALRDDHTAIVHYTTPDIAYDVISSVDLTTGVETIVHLFQDDVLNGGPVSAEHHGGNPIVASDGSIFFAIGDGYDPNMAGRPDWNLGKVFRISVDGAVEQFARGVRNPFDMSWDGKRLILPDNGDLIDDEINIVHPGDDLGWPYTAGSQPPIAGTVPPVYVFPTIVAPTGIVALTGANTMLRSGYLLTAFVTKALYFIGNIDAPAPLALIQKETDPLIDVTESASGDVYIASGKAIYRLVLPERGDCNGDGLVNADDLPALLAEIGDGGPHPMTIAQDGAYRGSWGCDVNADGLIDERDLAALKTRLSTRIRAVRSH